MNNFKMDERPILQRILRGLKWKNKLLKEKNSIPYAEIKLLIVRIPFLVSSFIFVVCMPPVFMN